MIKRIVALCLFAAPTFADDATDLKQRLLAMADFKADFTQKVNDENNQLISQGSGQLGFDFPNKLFWHGQQPDESVLVVDGQNVWLYNPFIEQVSIFNMQQAIAASPVTLLVQPNQGPWQDYLVRKDGHCYQITPKQTKGQNVLAVDVCFKGSTISSFALVDAQANVSQFTLAQQQALTAADAEKFQFELTPFMDVDDQRPQGD
ncbi:outer membrane lipoprotein chaperone LolA [Paraferrimonas sp. SM1919]|uniref:outer membrane lipoprotein chaperone LolA n=1 Tax=Paraferrimonas sp. SM1919 TaxID=2662263 RepID=UPI0013D6FC62|nr:outer membrane lipoprotein chaperone LolA [Paraferrimonas sp. SM1919]